MKEQEYLEMCNHFKEELEKKERMQEALVNKDFMIEKYPNMCRAVEKKYGWDVRLKHNFKLP